MSYKVLARKWRPDHFDEVVGQEHVARTLMNSIEQDRVAHSYLFCGARGVGKTSTARILAKAMNCEQGPTARPCYDCASCDEISGGQAVDVFEIDGASNRGINEIRELREGVRYAPSRDEHKIYIIDEVHMLTTEAFNALLKTLEEPPPHAIFIFATTEPQKIPVTILSRCQRFDFKRISQSDIVAHLEFLCEQEGLDAEKAALQVIARQANGGMRDALSLLDQIVSFSGDQITEREITEILGVANRKHLFELSRAALDRDAESALMVLDDVNRYGYDLQQFASELVNHFRDLMVTAVVREPQKVTQLTESELTSARRQVEEKPRELLHRYFSVMVDGAQQMSRSAFPKLIFEMTLVRLAELEPMEDLDVLVDRLRLLESTLEDDGGDDVDWPKSTVAKGGDEPPGKPQARTDDSVRAVRDDDDEAAPMSPPIDAYESTNDNQPKGEVATAEAVQTQTESTDTARKTTEKDGDQQPKIPQPLRPVGSDELQLPDVESLETAQQKWRAVVDLLRQENAPVALTCEHAHVETFEDGRVELRYRDGFLGLASEEERTEALQKAVRTLFGKDWVVDIERREGDDPQRHKTLAEERAEDIRRRRQELTRKMREHETVQAARRLFDADEPNVSVKLYDE